MDIEKALKLKTAKELRAACLEAEQRNVDFSVIRELYRLFYVALDNEDKKQKESLR